MARGFFRQFLRRHLLTSTGNDKSIKLLLWAPQYDRLTQQLGHWLGDIPIPKQAQTELFLHTLTKHQIETSLQQSASAPRLAIFVGHATAHELLGPPLNPKENGLPSVIYSQEMVHHGPEALFAFCSNAGQSLGKHFGSIPGRSFLGYRGDIAIDVTNEECAAQWQRIVIKMSMELIREGTILHRHKEFLEGLYDNAYNYFATGQGRMNPHRLLMQMYLLQHKQQLVLWKTNS